jgi:hypothetical protein
VTLKQFKTALSINGFDGFYRRVLNLITGLARKNQLTCQLSQQIKSDSTIILNVEFLI